MLLNGSAERKSERPKGSGLFVLGPLKRRTPAALQGAGGLQ